MSYKIKKVASHNAHWHHWSCNTCKTWLPSQYNNNLNIVEDILLARETATGSDLTDDQTKYAIRIYFWSRFLTSLDFITREGAPSAMWVFQRQVPSVHAALALVLRDRHGHETPADSTGVFGSPPSLFSKWKTSLDPLAQQHNLHKVLLQLWIQSLLPAPKGNLETEYFHHILCLRPSMSIWAVGHASVLE